MNKNSSFLAKRVLLILIVFGYTISTTYAVPAYSGWQTKTQPNGTPIEVRLVGDEFFSYWETRNGLIAEEQSDGRFVITNKRSSSSLITRARREALKLYQLEPHCAIGTRSTPPRGVVILVQFQDVKFQDENDQAAFNVMLNQEGYDYNGATGSAADYFKAQSNGQYQPVFDVIGPVTLSQNLAYYGEQGTVNNQTVNDLYLADFVIEAVRTADALCDYSQYDANKDGYVDMVYLIFAGKGQAAGGSSETIWPINWSLMGALYYNRTHGTTGCYYDSNTGVTYIPQLDGKFINTFACSAEQRSNGDRSGIGTFCHEFSHVLGLADLYDTTNGDNAKNNLTPNTWHLMDYGNYNNNENTPPNYSLWDKYFMGWVTPKFLARGEECNVTLSTDYGDGYQILDGTSRVSYSSGSTVYYLENRQQTGWDAYLPGHGMLVWKVRYSSSVWSNNAPNNTANSPRYTLVPADGKETGFGVASDAFVSGSYTPFEGGTILDIAEQDGTIRFVYNSIPTTPTEYSYYLYASNCTEEEQEGTVDVNAPLSLTIVPLNGYRLDDADCWTVEMNGTTLEYGVDFTYNATSHELRIEVVTGDVEIMVDPKVVLPTYTIHFIDLGDTISTQLVEQGQTTQTPDDPMSPCSDYTFAGWWTDELAADNTTTKTWVSDFTATQAQNYYAIYSKTVAGEGSGNYEKVTSTPSDWSGEYLIVYEAGKVIFNGSLDKPDVANNTLGVTISNGSISPTEAIEATRVTIAKSEKVYTILTTKGKYIGNASNSNSLSASDSKLTNEISLNGSDVTIKSSGGAHLRYNDASDQKRFRYIKSGSYTGQKAIQLYRKQGASSTTYYSSTVSCPSVPTAVENESQKPKAKSQKLLRNGRIVIQRGEERYTIFGQKIQ